MNAEELIKSGLLEAYVMGQLAGEQALLVERARANEPAVREELDAIETALEQNAMAEAVSPPSEVWSRVIDRIGTADGGRPRSGPSVLRTLPAVAVVQDSKWRWLAAAALLAFVVSAALNVMTYSELKGIRGELARLEQDRSVLAEELQVQRASFQATQEQLAIMSDPRMDVILLKGTGLEPDARARIYWDREGSAVHLDVMRLPEPPAGKQYQLWALVDGVPVDAGVFAMGGEVLPLRSMKGVAAAQAFAVTIEQAGGSPTPTLEAMVLMGAV